MKRAAARQGDFLRKSASRRGFFWGGVGAEGARGWVAMGHVREEGEGGRKC